MKGKIIKGIAGFYYVHAGDALHSTDGIYECKAKGVFRKDHRKPLVGDDVEMDIIDEAQKKGKYHRAASQTQRTDPSGGCQCGSGTCGICDKEAGPTF